MRAPRRTPYERLGALEHLYSLLYPGDQCDIVNDQGYRQRRSEGLAVVHLWLNRSACPHAVESTGSLIHAQELDEQLLILSLLPSTSEGSEWAVRCAYSTAILRFVNSVVDTFQTAMFAKSIFQISQRIGLPAYLVELRHAATHEELPSLVVLRDACRESLLWLQRSFWWPTLARKQSATSMKMDHTTNGSSSLLAVDQQPLQREAATQLRADLARYRKLAKRVVKDESLRGRYRTALSAAQSKVELCAKRYEADFGQIRGKSEDWEDDQVDGSAAALLVEALLEAGGLIPLSKRKRPRRMKGQDDELAKLPSQIFQTWLPLLNYLSAMVDSFSDALQEGLVGCLSLSPTSLGRSYLDTAASWTIALYGEDKAVLSAPKVSSRQLQSFSDMSEDDGGPEQDKPTLLLARRCLASPSTMSLAVARLLCAKDEQLTDRVKPLLEMAEASLLDKEVPEHQSLGDENADEVRVGERTAATDLELSVLEMEKRLHALQEKSAVSQELPPFPQLVSRAIHHNKVQVEVCKRLSGWHCAPDDWTPTPFGCLNGRVPQLILSDI